jgi:nicotinate-nucleotide pyrophosphorylase (carboxylating)
LQLAWRYVIPSHLLSELAHRALAEDLAGGDITTQALLVETTASEALVSAKQDLVLSGSEIFAATFYAVDGGVVVQALAEDGAKVEAGSELFRIIGRAGSLLMAERTALNFLQRLSGVATLTQRYVAAIPEGSALRIADTRKTTPGLRLLERAAVRDGGGHNHRNSLSSAIMIKDNHIAAVGNLTEAVLRAKAKAPHTSRIEVEVDSLEALDEALAQSVDLLLLDNFDPEALKTAVAMARGKALIEVSGGITLERIPELAALGVDVVSVGALTHSAPAADISLALRLASG